MKINRTCFLNAVAHGFEVYGHLKGAYFESKDGKQCGCSIGVAEKMLGIRTGVLGDIMLVDTGISSHASGYEVALYNVGRAIIQASDGANNGDQAYSAVMEAVDKVWPDYLVIYVDTEARH